MLYERFAKELIALRVRDLVIMTTRTADWFIHRGFVSQGPAHASSKLPQTRRQSIDPNRNSQLYVKTLSR